LGEAIFSPEMIWEAVPQCSCSSFVYEDYNSSYEELLQKAKVPSLQIRRMRTMALETYKIINKLAPVCLHDLVHMKNSKYSFRYNILEIPQIKVVFVLLYL
jgi:hypothetical protein